MMTHKPTIVAYAIYLFAITALFLYTAFPQAALRQFANSVGAQLGNNVALSVQQVAPTMPPGIVLKEIQLSHNGKPALQIERVTLSPDYLAAVAGSPSIRFRGALQGGSASGTVNGSEGWRLPAISARFKTLDLAQLPFMTELAPKRTVTGRASGDCQITLKPGGGAEAELTAVVTDATVGLLMPIGNIRSMAFDAIDLKASAAGDTVTISSCVWSSPLVSGRLSGKMSLRSPLGESTIALSGSVMPQQGLIKALGEPLAGRLFPGHRNRNKGFQVVLTGTLGKPGFDIK